MKALLSCLFLALAIQIQAQKELEPFHQIDVFGYIQLVLTQGDSYDYTASPESEDLKISVNEGRLKISHKHNEKMWTERTRVEVTYGQLQTINASAGALVEHRGILETADLKVNFDTGANGELEIKTSNMTAQTGEGSVLRLEGTTRTLEAKSTTGARLDASRLVARTVFATANTGGQLSVHASEFIEADATLGGMISYDGDPEKYRINESMGGTIKG